MTNYNERLDKIIANVSGKSFDAAINNPNDYAQVVIDAEAEAKQALIDWHNKQVEEVLDRLLKKQVTPAEYIYPVVPVHSIEAERNNLRESGDE